MKGGRSMFPTKRSACGRRSHGTLNEQKEFSVSRALTN